ncbi:MAG: hypothetical protein NTV43_03575 [Methylococcales bacterium]|nr:hypothetical protein [Methylococcales bacterium]
MAYLMLDFGSNPCSYPLIKLEENEKSILTNSNSTRPQLQGYFSNYGDDFFVVKNSFFNKKTEIPDVHRYDFDFFEGTVVQKRAALGNLLTFTQRKKKHNEEFIHIDKPLNNPANRNTLQNTILVILESPHISEYDENFNPLTLANGTTGDKFFNNFESHILSKLQSCLNLSNGTYSICFINPVPFQTSLNFIHKTSMEQDKTASVIRNKVWKAIYPYCERDFVSRIHLYQPIAIFNMCTGGLNKGVVEVDSLKHWVKLTIDANINCNIKFHAYHPSGIRGRNLSSPDLCVQW